MFQRWYDKDPKLSLAVACLENSDENLRKEIAKIIIQKAKSFNVMVLEPPFQLFKRWYDKEATLRLAMEHLRCAPPDVQKILSDLIILNISSKRSIYKTG